MAETIPQILLRQTETYPKHDLMLCKVQGRYVTISTEEFRRRISRTALGLRDLGVKPGDKVILLAENGPGWMMTDYAILSIGGITVPVYPSLLPEQIQHITDDSDAKVVVTSGRNLWEKLATVQSRLSKVDHFLSFEEEPAPGVRPLSEILARGEKIQSENSRLFEESALAVRPDDLASIIYTSGTMGVPKGVMLTHANLVSNINTLASIIDFNVHDTVLSFLPLSHVLERMVTFAFLSRGCSIAYAESVETVAENLLEVRPTIMVSVPRLFEKIYAKVMDAVLAGSGLKKKIFFWALKTGKAYGERELRRQPISSSLRRKRSLAQRLLFSTILI